MRTDNRHGIEVRAGDPAPPSAPDDDLGSGTGAASPGAEMKRPPRGPLTAAAAVVVALAVVATGALALTRGNDDVVARSVPPAAVQPAVPQPLGLAVEVPDTLAAGERAQLTVRWTDGSGTFSGSTEDWGDGVATNSRKQGRCEPGTAASPAAAGTYELGHVWSEPGTYTVIVGVATYVCESGTAVEDEAVKTLTITVVRAN